MISFFKELYIFYMETAPYMLFGLIFVGLLHVFVSKDFIIRHIGSNSVMSAVKASILGVPLPLCSCGVVPTAVYFSKNGASKGAVISFLISTPQTGIDSIIATYGLLGPIFAVFRPFAAFFSGVSGGIIANLFIKKEQLNITEEQTHTECSDSSCSVIEKRSKLHSFYDFAFNEFLDDISIQLIFGIFLAALISFFVPADFFIKYNIGQGFSGMAIMIIAGIPMYICATASIPVALALLSKGVSPGAAFVFLAVGPMTNAASISILFKILKKNMMIIYLASGIIFAILSGFILDLIYKKFNLAIPEVITKSAANTENLSLILKTAAIIFSVLLILSVYRNLKNISGRIINGKKH
ncbi:MAG: SO_0444 family Cu/Zn efflux transporter [Spirochaetes bacterium]|nr:SO_0444 family Cu/Zn efflux transporter [Spirochaetota bacterium]